MLVYKLHCLVVCFTHCVGGDSRCSSDVMASVWYRLHGTLSGPA